MELIETSVFTKQIDRILDAKSHRLLQLELADRPDAGAVIPGSGGLRKLRWRSGSSGKRGGLRVIYYWVGAEDVILLLLAYLKSDQADLSASQLKQLKALVQEELK